MKESCVQLYYGDGKGKTTAAMGQIMRCVGHGFQVLVYQFLKPPTSGEVKILRTLPGVEYIANEHPIPFLFNLPAEQHAAFRKIFTDTFEIVQEKIRSGRYDLVVLDEAIDAYVLGVLPREQLHEVIDHKPVNTEMVITGHAYGQDIGELFRRSDYITHFVKEKHPFDLGLTSRQGIEE